MLLLGFASFYGLLPFGSERCGPAGPVGFSRVLLRSKHDKPDFARFSEVLPAFIGFCCLDQKGARPQLPLAFPWFYCVLSLILLVSLSFPGFYCVRSMILLVFTRFR